MNKLLELRAALEAKKVEIRGFLDAKDAEKATVAVKEKRDLEKLIEIEEQIEVEERTALEGQKKREGRSVKAEETTEFRSIVKHVIGEELSPEERASIKSTDNAAVIPKQFVNQLQEVKKGFGSIKEYCDIIPVTKNEGTIPVVDLDQNTLPEVLEGDNIVDGTLVTTDLPFKCAKHGLIQSLTSETVDDAEVEIEGLVNKNFAEIVVVAENTKIIKVIKDNATAAPGTTYSDVEKEIDKAAPAVAAGLCVLTNTSGFAYLNNLKDTQGRTLNLVTELNGKKYFHGKELIVADDTLVAPAVAGKTIIYLANVREAVKFCDRKAVTIAQSTEAGFRDDTKKIRILERFAVVKGPVRSIKKFEF